MPVMESPEIDLVRPLHWRRDDGGDEALIGKEWLVTNGLGGYASGTVAFTACWSPRCPIRSGGR